MTAILKLIIFPWSQFSFRRCYRYRCHQHHHHKYDSITTTSHILIFNHFYLLYHHFKNYWNYQCTDNFIATNCTSLLKWAIMLPFLHSNACKIIPALLFALKGCVAHHKNHLLDHYHPQLPLPLSPAQLSIAITTFMIRLTLLWCSSSNWRLSWDYRLSWDFRLIRHRYIAIFRFFWKVIAIDI